MNIIIKTVRITVCLLAMTAATAAFADSAGGPTVATSTKVLHGAAIGLTMTLGIQESTGNTAATVSYPASHLDSEEGVQALYGLLQRASKEVCGSGTIRHGQSPIMKSSRVRCFRKALSDAVDSIGNENLTRIHSG